MQRTGLLVALALGLALMVACRPDYRQLSPTMVVSKAFMAYRDADLATFNALISTTGEKWAEAHCRYGEPIQCLVRQYDGAQHLILYSTEQLTQTETAAEVILRSSWSVLPEKYYCQNFTLEKTDVGWKIVSMEPPQPCINPTATMTPTP